MSITYPAQNDFYDIDVINANFQELAGNISSNTTAIANTYTKAQADTLLANKVDKATGKGLSTNDFTNAYKSQVDTNAIDISKYDSSLTLYVNAATGSDSNDGLTSSTAFLTLSKAFDLSVKYKKVVINLAVGTYIIPNKSASFTGKYMHIIGGSSDATQTIIKGNLNFEKSTFYASRITFDTTDSATSDTTALSGLCFTFNSNVYISSAIINTVMNYCTYGSVNCRLSFNSVTFAGATVNTVYSTNFTEIFIYNSINNTAVPARVGGGSIMSIISAAGVSFSYISETSGIVFVNGVKVAPLTPTGKVIQLDSNNTAENIQYNLNDTTRIATLAADVGVFNEVVIPDYVIASTGKIYQVQLTLDKSVSGTSIFSSSSMIFNLTTPNTLTTINRRLCSGCTSLKNVNFKFGLVTISGVAFYACTSLTSVAIPKSCTTLDLDCFRNCSALTTLYLPSSLTTVNNTAFYGCTALKNVYLDKNFDAALNISYSTLFTADDLVAIIAKLKDNTGLTAKTLTIGSTNLAKLTAEQIAVATAKNWGLN